jgi:hypothetical protein
VRISAWALLLLVLAAGCAAGDDPELVAWERNGEPATQEEFVLARGPAHCDRTSVTFLWMSGRHYVRDPEGALPPEYAVGLDLDA